MGYSTGRTRDSGMQSEEWKAVLAIADEISKERWGSPLRMNAIRWGCRLAERLQRKFVMEGIRHTHAFKDHRDSTRRLRPVMSPREDGGLTTGTDDREKEQKRGRSPFHLLPTEWGASSEHRQRIRGPRRSRFRPCGRVRFECRGGCKEGRFFPYSLV